jgi:Flp pilus assembly protein TadG
VTKGRRIRRRRTGERGQALVEMVILLPLFLLLVFGMIEFGRVFNYWINMTHLASEGSRYAIVNKWPGCPGFNQSDGACTPATLQEYLVQRANTGELRSELAQTGGVLVCYPENTLNPGDPVRVVVNAEIKLPVLDSLLGLLGVDEVLNMRASSTERLEWTPDRLDSSAEGVVTPCP